MINRLLLISLIGMALSGCDPIEGRKLSSDEVQRQQQEVLLQEGTSKVGMPNIVNFRERKMLKEILELRDQAGFATYTYVWNEMTGKKIFFCHSIGYGIPYATQFTSPQKLERQSINWGNGNGYGNYVNVMPQADPNGLFSPAAAEGTWVLCKNPKGDDVKPVYIEPRIIVSPFELPDAPEVLAPTKK